MTPVEAQIELDAARAEHRKLTRRWERELAKSAERIRLARVALSTAKQRTIVEGAES